MTTLSGRVRRAEMQLLFLPAVCAVIGLLILVTVRTGVARWGWQDMSVGLTVVFAFYVVSIFFSAVGFAGDEMLFPITAALASLGFLMIQRLGPAVAPSAHLAEKQLIYLLVALVLMTGIAVGMKRQHLRLLRDYKYSWALVGIALTAAVMVFGVEINGARLWFNLKFFYFQPAEMLKIILVIFFAAYLSEKRELLNAPYAIGRVRLPPLPYMLPMIALWGLSLMIVVVEKDLGQGLLIFGVFLAMLYLANGKISYVIGGLIAFAIGAYVLYRIFPHVQVRVQIWLDPWSRGQGTGAQLVQSQYALASGGIFGSGLGLGDPTNIPLVQTDFVFSAIGEELGLLGTMALLVFYLFFVYRGVRIALDAVDDFSRYLAAGLTAVLGLQAFIIIGGTVGLFPLTGITLPFISYGGSSLLSNFIIVGMLLAISGMRPGRAVAIPGVPT
ncbi:MAG: FtsW/RodA/SpoVE family cell cycle protein [Thermomicrobiales bacterium]